MGYGENYFAFRTRREIWREESTRLYRSYCLIEPYFIGPKCALLRILPIHQLKTEIISLKCHYYVTLTLITVKIT